MKSLKNKMSGYKPDKRTLYLANMSHEIRTPMNAIYGMAELMEDMETGVKEKEYVAVIKRSSESLLSIINEILDFSKIDSGKLEIIEEPYSFREMLQDVVTIIEFRMRDKNLSFILDMPDNLPGRLFGDSNRIRQILLNLLTNAVKYKMGRGQELFRSQRYTYHKRCRYRNRHIRGKHAEALYGFRAGKYKKEQECGRHRTGTCHFKEPFRTDGRKHRSGIQRRRGI